MRRFFVEKITRPTTVLDGNEWKHLSEVLRARVGDRVILCPNDGRDYVFEIKSCDRKSATLEYAEDYPNTTEPKADVTVFASLLKGDKTEYAVQKLTELGVKRIVPFIGEYTVQRSEKSERLRRAAHEAAKQCGRARIPEVEEPMPFASIVPMLSAFDKVVFAYEGAYASGQRLRDVIDGTEKSVALIVGAEGGFAGKEVQTLTNAGYLPVTLGKRILRAETAAVAGAAVLMFLLGEWQ